jgi:hypothetical protein
VALEISEEAEPAAIFATQIIVGTILFALALLAAFGLDRLVAWIASAGAPTWMVFVAHLFEKLLFYLDLVLFGLFLVSEASKFVIGLGADWRSWWQK